MNARGGLAAAGEITALPFADARFNLVAAFDVIEHVEDDRRVFRELSRVLQDDGIVIFSVPLHPEAVDGVRRARGPCPPVCDPAQLRGDRRRLHGLVIEQSAKFGMKTRQSPPG